MNIRSLVTSAVFAGMLVTALPAQEVRFQTLEMSTFKRQTEPQIVTIANRHRRHRHHRKHVVHSRVPSSHAAATQPVMGVAD